MKKNESGRSGLLLMEIIIAILFFSVVSAVCLQLFVKAHNLSQDTVELDMAVRKASSAAEICSQSEMPFQKLQELYKLSDIKDDKASIYYDNGFMECESDTAAYHMDIISEKADDRTVTYHIAIYSADEEEIYRLEITAYNQYLPED